MLQETDIIAASAAAPAHTYEETHGDAATSVTSVTSATSATSSNHNKEGLQEQSVDSATDTEDKGIDATAGNKGIGLRDTEGQQDHSVDPAADTECMDTDGQQDHAVDPAGHTECNTDHVSSSRSGQETSDGDTVNQRTSGDASSVDHVSSSRRSSQGTDGPSDDGDTVNQETGGEDASNRTCPGHQVAVPIDVTVQELDIKAESKHVMEWNIQPFT